VFKNFLDPRVGSQYLIINFYRASTLQDPRIRGSKADPKAIRAFRKFHRSRTQESTIPGFKNPKIRESKVDSSRLVESSTWSPEDPRITTRGSIGIQFVRDATPLVFFYLFFFYRGIGQTYAYLHSLINSSLLQQTTCGDRGYRRSRTGKNRFYSPQYRGRSLQTDHDGVSHLECTFRTRFSFWSAAVVFAVLYNSLRTHPLSRPLFSRSRLVISDSNYTG